MYTSTVSPSLYLIVTVLSPLFQAALPSRHHNSSFVSMPSPVYGIINAPDFDLKPAGDSSEAIQFIDLTDSSPMFLKITYS